jgi:hypothetical protein
LLSGMPDEHDTALHSTREQPIRPINLARAGADGPEPRRQVHFTLCFESASRYPAFGSRGIERGVNPCPRAHMSQKKPRDARERQRDREGPERTSPACRYLL